MFSIERPETNRIEVKVSGKFDAEMMKAAIDELLSTTEGIRFGKMSYELTDIALPSAGAIKEEISRMPELLDLAKRFDRIAVLADSMWVRAASEIEGALMPGLEVKAFDLDKDVEAVAWLKTSPSKR